MLGDDIRKLPIKVRIRVREVLDALEGNDLELALELADKVFIDYQIIAVRYVK